MAKDKSRVTREPVTREYTINLHKRLHGITFKKRAPRAVKEIKKFAATLMKTKEVRVDVKLNKEVWKQVSRQPPRALPRGSALVRRLASRHGATGHRAGGRIPHWALGGGPVPEDAPRWRLPTLPPRRASGTCPTSCASSSKERGTRTRTTRRAPTRAARPRTPATAPRAANASPAPTDRRADRRAATPCPN